MVSSEPDEPGRELDHTNSINSNSDRSVRVVSTNEGGSDEEQCVILSGFVKFG